MANKNLREVFLMISENIELGDFNIEDIPNVELPENFNDDFHKNWLTEDAAKNNPSLMGHFKGKYLSSSDLKIKNVLKAAGFTEEQFTEFKSSVDNDSLKLIDLAFDKIKSIKSDEKPAKDDKALEKLTLESGKAIDDLQLKLENSNKVMSEAVATKDLEWRRKFVNVKMDSILGSKQFSDGIGREDALYLIKRKIEDSNYQLNLDDNLDFKIYDKANPDTLAIKDGKPVTITDVLDEYSQPYTQKNNQGTSKPEKREVSVETEKKISDEEGRYIVGHPNYGK